VNLDAHARRAAAALHDSADAVDPVGRLRDLGSLERRRARTQVALALVLLLGLVAVAGLLVSRRDLPVVGPVPSRATIQVGRQPTLVVIGQGAVWVANQFDNSVSRIDPQTNRVVATIPVPDGVADLAVGRDAIWAAGDLVVRIDPQTNRVVATVPLGAQPSSLAATDDAVWVTNVVDGTITRIDPQTNQVTATIHTVGEPVQVAANDRAVWVAYPPGQPGPAHRPEDQPGGGNAQSRPATRPRPRLWFGVDPERALRPGGADRPPDQHRHRHRAGRLGPVRPGRR
jgi:YVTN family beta-propeller protein